MKLGTILLTHDDLDADDGLPPWGVTIAWGEDFSDVHDTERRYPSPGAALDAGVKWATGRGLGLHVLGASFAIDRRGGTGR